MRPLLGEELVHSDGVIHHMNFPDPDGKVMELDRLTEMSMNEVCSHLTLHKPTMVLSSSKVQLSSGHDELFEVPTSLYHSTRKWF